MKINHQAYFESTLGAVVAEQRFKAVISKPAFSPSTLYRYDAIRGHLDTERLHEPALRTPLALACCREAKPCIDIPVWVYSAINMLAGDEVDILMLGFLHFTSRAGIQHRYAIGLAERDYAPAKASGSLGDLTISIIHSLATYLAAYDEQISAWPACAEDLKSG